MRETALSNCERDFILASIKDKLRLDGRQSYDFRKLKISFGIDRGCCEVFIGDTRVLAQVSCEVTQPKQNRQNDGILFANVDLSPMASPAFEPGKTLEYTVELNRLLERCLKESRCLDTESLCIVAGEMAWQVRVDVTVLNYDGNVIDAVSIAAISALSHFRRPDVTVSGEDVTIHPVDEREPVPLSIHHMPICVSFAFFEQGQYLLVDPTDKEEKVMDGRMVIGMNKHREICTLQITGNMLLVKDQVLRCSNIAVVKVVEITELIHKALENDKKARSEGKKCGFAESVVPDKVTYSHTDVIDVSLSDVEEKATEIVENGHITVSSDSEGTEEPKNAVKVLGKGTAVIGEGGPSTWNIDEDMEAEINTEQKQINILSCDRLAAVPDTGEESESDSEEETTVILQNIDTGNTIENKRLKKNKLDKKSSEHKSGKKKKDKISGKKKKKKAEN